MIYRSQNFNWIIQIDFFDKQTLFISHLFRLYKKHVKKRSKRQNKSNFYKDKKIKIKYIIYRIKYRNVPGFFWMCMFMLKINLT